MEITHGIAMFFLVLFFLIGTFYRKVLVWLLPLAYSVVLGWFAIINTWEILFYPVILTLGICSLIGFIYSCIQGDII